MPKRKVYSGEFKARVALEVLKGQRTVNEIAAAHEIHPGQAQQWKKQAVSVLPEAMSDRRRRQELEADARTEELYAEIGRLRMELEWLKKKSGITQGRSG